MMNAFAGVIGIIFVFVYFAIIAGMFFILYLVIKNAIKNGIKESGLVNAINKSNVEIKKPLEVNRHLQ